MRATGQSPIRREHPSRCPLHLPVRDGRETAPCANTRRHVIDSSTVQARHLCSRVNPRCVRDQPPPKRVRFARGSDAKKRKSEQDVRQDGGKRRKTEPSLRLPAALFRVQRQRGAKRQRLPATEVQKEKRPFATFFRASPVILNAQLATDAIEMPNTDVDAELFLQCCFHFSAWRLWSHPAESLQPLEYTF